VTTTGQGTVAGTTGLGTTGLATTGFGTTGFGTTGMSSAGFTSGGTTTGTVSGTSSGTGAASTTGSATTGSAQLENFSFFVTSLAGLQMLSGSPEAFGGNLSYGGQVGIAGADLICSTLADMSMPGAGAKGWRAFLSTTTEDAIDRIGQGPWYDREGRLVADDSAGLLEDRPDGDSGISEDLPNEFGIPNSAPDGESLDNHDTMTASDEEGRLVMGTQQGGGGGGFSTCMDWTSAEPGQDPPMMGHSWPAQSGTNWIEVGRHGSGCEPLVHLEQTGGANGCGAVGVGCGGGYGGFYCFALTP
jgi:hypothetical protein